MVGQEVTDENKQREEIMQATKDVHRDHVLFVWYSLYPWLRTEKQQLIDIEIRFSLKWRTYQTTENVHFLLHLFQLYALTIGMEITCMKINKCYCGYVFKSFQNSKYVDFQFQTFHLIL